MSKIELTEQELYSIMWDIRVRKDVIDKQRLIVLIDEKIAEIKAKHNEVLDLVSKRPTEIKDRNGVMINFGDTMIFSDKLEWYKGEYFVDILAGRMTGEEAKQKINEKPYETRKVESVEDYEWLLSSEIQSWWEVVC